MINKVICGDSIEEMNKMQPNSVDLIFADPPYWMRTEGVLKRVEGTDFDGCDDTWDKFDSLEDYEDFTKKWLSACHRILKPNGSIWVIGGMQCIYTIGSTMQDLGFWLVNDVIWHKKNPTPNFMGTRLNNSHETLIWATKSKKSKYTFNYKTAKELNVDSVTEDEYSKGVRKQMGSVWRFPVCSGLERLKDENGEKHYFLKNHIYDKITIRDISKELDMSESTIKQLFSKYREGGIIHYYNTLKIKEARKLIREGIYNMAQISDILQFDSPQYFSKCFKAVTNMTPSEYKASIMG